MGATEADVSGAGGGGPQRRLCPRQSGQFGGGQVARNQAHRWPIRAQAQAAQAHVLHARHARHALRVGADIELALQQPHIHIRGQHHIEPMDHRLPKTVHHHRQGHRQAQAGDHACDGDAGDLAGMANALECQHGQGASGRWQTRQHQLHGQGHAGNSTEQQARNSGISSQGQAAIGGHPSQCDAGQQEHGAPAAGQALRLGVANAFEDLSERQVLGPAGGRDARDGGCGHAQQQMQAKLQGADHQLRAQLLEVAATEVAAQAPQGQFGQCHAQRQAQRRADETCQQGLAEYPVAPLTRGQTHHTKQGDGGQASAEGQGLDRIDQKTTGDQGHQGQHR